MLWSMITSQFYSLAVPTSQFLNGTHEFSELLQASPAGEADWGAGTRNDVGPAPQSACPAGLLQARWALLMNHSRSILPFRSRPKRGNRKIVPFKLARNYSFWPIKPDQRRATCVSLLPAKCYAAKRCFFIWPPPRQFILFISLIRLKNVYIFFC